MRGYVLSKLDVVITHPKEWATAEYAAGSRFKYHHVSMGGKVPRKRDGTVTYDGYAEVTAQEAIDRLYHLFKTLKPAVFLFWIHVGLTPRVLSTLKTLSPSTRFVMWFGNHRNKLAGNVTKVAHLLDMLLLNSKDPGQYELYNKSGLRHVQTLWDGFAPSEVNLVEDAPEYDVFFGGETYMMDAKSNPKLEFPGGPLRYRFITEVNRHFKLLVCSSRPRAWPFQTMPGVFHPMYTSALRRGKVTLNLNHYPSFEKAYTRRTIRSMFARRCHLTLYIPKMEEDGFVNHRNIVWFNYYENNIEKTVNEGIDLLRYYVDHDVEREQIAWNGWRFAMANFTFEHRLKDFERFIVDAFFKAGEKE